VLPTSTGKKICFREVEVSCCFHTNALNVPSYGSWHYLE